MVSIIICGRAPQIDPDFSANIASTIGCEYEIIYIDNSRGEHNIFQAYNRGAQRAKGDTLCFSHDDIRFNTKGWGAIAERVVAETGGIVGIIGNQMMPQCEASWWTAPFKVGIITHHINGIVKTDNFLPSQCPCEPSATTHEAVTVDGLWFCMPRLLFGQIQFDEETYNGFHCYDSDICMQAIVKGHPVTVVCNIDIEHFSDGHLTNGFFEQRERWFAKWEKYLPVVRGISLSAQEIEIINQMAREANHWTHETTIAQEEIRRLRNTIAYRLGKKLLHPFSTTKH